MVLKKQGARRSGRKDEAPTALRPRPSSSLGQSPLKRPLSLFDCGKVRRSHSFAGLRSRSCVKADKKIKRKKSRYLSVIIPAQNDKRRLPAVLIEIDRYLEKSGLTYEILIADAGSTDGSLKTIERLSELIKNAQLVDLKERSVKSKAEACYLAVLKASGEWLLFLDIDRLPSLEDLLSRLKNKEFSADEVWVGKKPFLPIEKKWIFKKMPADWPNLILHFLFGSSIMTFLCLKSDSVRNLWPLIEKEEKTSIIKLFFLMKASGCQGGEVLAPIVNQADNCSDKLYFWLFLREWIREKLFRR